MNFLEAFRILTDDDSNTFQNYCNKVIFIFILKPKIHEYAERLTETLPDPLKCVYFVNSGSEANDLAMYMARLYTGNFDIVSFRNSYHGEGNFTVKLDPNKFIA